LDPDRGARRRALVRDKLTRASHKTRDGYDATRRDVGNRLAGAAAELQARVTGETPDDRTVEARVRAALGRVSSHPRAVCVSATDGFVVLSGDVLSGESKAVEAAVRGVRGVRDVSNQLTVHESAANIPALQGGSSPADGWAGWAASGWSPTAKVLVGVGAAVSLAAAVAARRS
jgi:hypothetical protein